MSTTAPNMPNPIPHSSFWFDAIPAKERFAAWSDSISTLFLPRLAPEVSPDEVSMTTEIFMLGDVLLGRSETVGIGGYETPGNSAIRDRSELYIIQLYLTGGFVGFNSTATLRVNAGDIVILDLSRAMTTSVSDSAILSFILPRESLLALVGPRHMPAPGIVPGDTPAGRVLASTFRSVWQALPQASMEQGHALGKLLLGAIAGSLLGSSRDDGAESPGEVALDCATFDAMRGYIARHLAQQELSPEHLCRQFNCSRARLYRLFAPVGGVRSYITRARLERVYEDLLFADDNHSVMEIALRWGFGNLSHFFRLFRATFATTPGEIRAMGHAARLSRKASPNSSSGGSLWLPEYHDWMLRL